MASLEELKQEAHDQRLIRKFLDGIAAIAPYSAAVPEAWTTNGKTPISLPEGYQGLGIVMKDSGYEFGVDSDQEEVEGHGYASPVRIDMTKTTRSVQMTCLETRKSVLEQYYGLDLSAVQPDEQGSIEFNEPETLSRPYSRLVIIGSDGVGEDQWFWAKIMPRAQVSEVGSHSWNNDASAYELTFTAFPDPELGYSVKNIIFGPAAAKNAAAMGFQA